MKSLLIIAAVLAVGAASPALADAGGNGNGNCGVGNGNGGPTECHTGGGGGDNGGGGGGGDATVTIGDVDNSSSATGGNATGGNATATGGNATGGSSVSNATGGDASSSATGGSANSGGNNLGVSFRDRRQAPAVHSPTVMVGQCQKSLSGGISTPLGGFNLGGSRTDVDCEQRWYIEKLEEWGMIPTACQLAALNRRVALAMKRTGYGCPAYPTAPAK